CAELDTIGPMMVERGCAEPRLDRTRPGECDRDVVGGPLSPGEPEHDHGGRSRRGTHGRDLPPTAPGEGGIVLVPRSRQPGRDPDPVIDVALAARAMSEVRERR